MRNHNMRNLPTHVTKIANFKQMDKWMREGRGDADRRIKDKENEVGVCKRFYD